MSNRNNTTSQGLHNSNITIRFAERDATTASNPTARHQDNTLDRVNKLSSDMLACQLDYTSLKEDHDELVATAIWQAIVVLFLVTVVVSVGFLYMLMFEYLSTDEHEFHGGVRELRRNVREWLADSGPVE
ncbi:hypothetical protein FIE12Z_12233 [Fusarium flagelliforme]|uniref:Uncharacterized protein n=1 Tax=Fusarium flagelliforme TaxID=2675880 RepID=A0A395M8A1_9HYPO|nr:hypothetical protein FIE12Z_12233 [Fusarium flagelliforme]